MDFLKENSIWLYLFIFFGKILEVTVATVRMVLINRGERVKGAFIAVFEISLWLIVTGTVLVGFQEDIVRCVIFAIAFAIGNYMGSWLESKLAFGFCSLQVILSEQVEKEVLLEELRQREFAVTAIKGTGKDGERDLLILHLKRKRIPQAIDIINEHVDKPVIVVSDSKSIYGGYIRK